MSVFLLIGISELCNVLQCVAVWCSLLQLVALCCSVRFYLELTMSDFEMMGGSVPTHRYLCVLQYVTVCCSMLQCVAVCCSVLQCVAVCYSVLP